MLATTLNETEKSSLGLAEKIMRAPFTPKWFQDPAKLVEKLIHPDSVLAASGALVLIGSVLLFLGKKVRSTNLLSSQSLLEILRKIEFKMYYPGALAFVQSVMVL